MPNIPPRGAFGRAAGSAGVPTEVLDVVATIIGETTPRNCLEIWASDASGVKALVWARTPDGPASASLSYVSGTPAANGLVRVAITPSSPLRSDSYQIKRSDGSVAGTATQNATTFDDTAPLPVSGTYTVTAMLAGLVDASPTVTGSLNLTGAPASGSATLVDNRGSGGSMYVHLAWTAPAWGKPHQYQIWRNGSLYTTVSGDLLTYDDSGVLQGSTMSYNIYPVLSGVLGPNPRAVSTAVGQDAPTGVALSNPAADTLRLAWTAPAQYSYFEVQYYDSAVGFVWTALTTTTGFSADWSTANAGYMRVRALSSTGIASSWVQAGPITPKPPAVPAVGMSLYVSSDYAYAGLLVTLNAPVGQSYEAQNYRTDINAWEASGYETLYTPHTVTGSEGGVWEFRAYRLDSRHGAVGVYMRARRVRNGVGSDWTQLGPV